MYSEYASLIETLGLSDRVKLLGNVSRSAMINYYQNALAVCFTPFDEDYGFVTAEAMLCAKPVGPQNWWFMEKRASCQRLIPNV